MAGKLSDQQKWLHFNVFFADIMLKRTSHLDQENFDLLLRKIDRSQN